MVFKVDESEWTLDLREGTQGALYAGAPRDGEKADLTLTITDGNFVQLVMGKLNPQQVRAIALAGPGMLPCTWGVPHRKGHTTAVHANLRTAPCMVMRGRGRACPLSVHDCCMRPLLMAFSVHRHMAATATCAPLHHAWRRPQPLAWCGHSAPAAFLYQVYPPVWRLLTRCHACHATCCGLSQAFLMRKLKINGSMGMAMKLQPILDAAQPKAKL